MNKKEFKTLLNNLLNKELEELRKRFRPYKRKPFLNQKVTIGIDEKYSSKGCLGYYRNTRENERQRKYIHNIFITKLAIEDYKKYVKWKWKSRAIFNLRQIIRHELIHAWVFEEFEEWEMIEGCYGDYSPIFLGCLYWANGHSGHAYTDKFIETDLCKEIEKCKNYDLVYVHLVNYIMEIERTVRHINKSMERNNQDHKTLKIEFNRYGAGIVKRKYISVKTETKKDNKLYRQKLTQVTLGLGFLVTPKTLLESYERKFNNGAMAQVHSEIVAYIVDDNIKQQRTIAEKIN